ncbi:MAG: hypothetical protein M3Y13_14640, partial [Armatimonadota bacterium]|nr:hypothetical protein [Armatimonadota bacterium]
AAHPQAVFVTAHVDLTGGRGSLLGGRGASQTASGELPAPGPGLVLWRVIERVAVEKQLQARSIAPADDGQSVSYSYTVKGGGGGLFAIDEPGQFVAELVAVYAPPAFLPTVGQVEIVSTSVPQDAPQGTRAGASRAQSPSSAQLEGRLIRLPGEENDRRVWFVQNGVKRLLESPTCGRLRFGDGWQRLIQPLGTAEDANIVPDGPPLTIAECAEGKLVYSWPQTKTYWVQAGQRRRIDDPKPIVERFGERWRIKLIHLRPTDLEAIPDGERIATETNL